MKSPLHILHLEDEPNDAMIVRTLFETAGIDCAIEVVQTRAHFESRLQRDGVDLILSDHSLPAFDGLSALEIANAFQPDVPFILVSGTMEDELAVTALKRGATDYILKERLFRLVPAVRRAMREVGEIAERRRLEAQFIEAQKMDVMGRLAGGVAHDFNNILSVIMGYSESVINGLGADHPLRADAEETRLAAERGAALARQLLVFSSRQTTESVVLDLNDVVQTFHKMLQRLIGENIEMTVRAEKALGRVKADSGHIGQILMNMVVNARDAMPQGGRLVIETRNVRLAEARRGRCGRIPAGDYVVLSVRDEGIGMTEEVQGHIFEAFYTTKAKGIGTGLGLATCRTIIRQSGGCVDFSSELGLGTTFWVYFPRVDQPLESKVRVVGGGPLPRGTETLLLVEDDPALSRLACRTLHKLGYTVLSANNGQEGLRQAFESPRPQIDLVITDVVMPQMGGWLMAERLKAIYPDLKFLFTSGYAGDVLARHGALDAGVAVLQKPYTPSILARKVREMIDRP